MSNETVVVDHETGEIVAVVPAEAVPARAQLVTSAPVAQVAQAQADYRALCAALLDDGDYQAISGRRFPKKSAWRKLATAFNVSVTLVERRYDRDDAGRITRAEVLVRADGRPRDLLGVRAMLPAAVYPPACTLRPGLSGRPDALLGSGTRHPGYRHDPGRQPGVLGPVRHGRGIGRGDDRGPGRGLGRTWSRLSAEEIATGYKALYEAERGRRDLKSTIDLRPVFHRREDRIRAHVQLCWLALLVARVAEIGAGDTWRNLRNELERLHLVTRVTSEGTVSQRSELTPAERSILSALEVPEPPRFYDFRPAPELGEAG